MNGYTVLDSVEGVTQSNDATSFMNVEPAPVPRDFLLKQIENEINAGFVFVESARKAYKRQHAAEADGALDKAAKTHQQILKQVLESPAAQVRAITHQLTELREAIEWLRETIVTSAR